MQIGRNEKWRLIEECMPNSTSTEYRGTPFLIVEDRDEIGRFMYEVVRLACGEGAVDKYYRDRGAVKQINGERIIEFGELGIGEAKPDYIGPWRGILAEYPPYIVPDEVRNKLIEAGFIKDGYSADFQSIVGQCYGFGDFGYRNEYSTCDHCGDAVRIAPDSYSWIGDFWVNHNIELLCGNCIRSKPELVCKYIHSIINNHKCANAVLPEEQIEEMGFTLLNGNTYTGGWLGGSRPAQQLEALSTKYDNVLFDVLSVGQFDIRWRVWVKNQDEE